MSEKRQNLSPHVPLSIRSEICSECVKCSTCALSNDWIAPRQSQAIAASEAYKWHPLAAWAGQKITEANYKQLELEE